MLFNLHTLLRTLTARFRDDERGVTAIEYGLIAALVAIGIILAATTLGEELSATFNFISDELSGAR